MSGGNSITVWDRQSDADQFHMRRTLELLGMAGPVVKAHMRRTWRYSVFPCFGKMIASHNALPLFPVKGEDDLRRLIGELNEYCVLEGIRHVDIYGSPSLAVVAMVAEMNAPAHHSALEVRARLPSRG